MISRFSFLESTTGWIFAVTKNFGVTLVALEPLPPLAPFSNETGALTDFLHAVSELQKMAGKSPIAFISIGETFARALNQRNFYNFQVGKEPWVNLSDYEPRGNKGKGIRAAKNQAIRAGLTVETWSIAELLKNSDLKNQVNAIHHAWLRKTLVSLEGFLLKTDPWQLSEDRFCFLARKESGEVQGVLIGTPVQKNRSWYLEDLWLSPNHARGIGELLTLEAMASLKAKGAEKVSLGVIPLTDLNFLANSEAVASIRPSLFAVSIQFLAKVTETFYSANGLILFRKRFQVEIWSPVFISIYCEESSGWLRSWRWLQAMIALGLAHAPKIYFKSFVQRLFSVRKKITPPKTENRP